MVFDRLRAWLRRCFTRVVYEPVGDEFEQVPRTAGRTRRRHSSRRRSRLAVPSERFVWGMVALIISLVGTIILEGVHIVVAGRLSPELFALISGLLGSFTTAFLMGGSDER